MCYCSKACQARDWKTHKPSCPPHVIREIPGKGRGIFASRRIKEGEVILETEAGLNSIISLINQSSIANVSTSWVTGELRRKQFRALAVIEKGEEILASHRHIEEVR